MNDDLDILKDDNIHFGPFPMHHLKRVDKSTTIITDEIQRFKAADEFLMQAMKGKLGTILQRKATQEDGPDGPYRYPISKAQWEVLGRVGSARGDEVAAKKAPIPEDPKILSRHIKRLGYFLGADIIGICRLPKWAVYASDYAGNPIDVEYKYAIVIVERKEHETSAATAGSDYMGDPMSFKAYLPAAMHAEVIASYIKKLGYPASPQSMAGGPFAHKSAIGETSWYHVLISPLLLLAGIGEVSRTHMILNPFLGPSFKASAVLTDLPLDIDKPIDFGLQDFCKKCKICAEACPTKAISFGDKVMHNGYETWAIDGRKCISFMLLNKRGNTCNMCTKVCPWTRPYNLPHRAVRYAVMNSGLARTIAVKWDNFFGRGKQEKGKWWFDLCYDKNGLLKIPEKKE